LFEHAAANSDSATSGTVAAQNLFLIGSTPSIARARPWRPVGILATGREQRQTSRRGARLPFLTHRATVQSA
jgi:hypothetical protein